jgi:hypothetical protein
MRTGTAEPGLLAYLTQPRRHDPIDAQLPALDDAPENQRRTLSSAERRFADAAGSKCSLPSVGGQPRLPLLSPDAKGDLQEATSRPALAKSLCHPAIVDGHAPEDHVLALQHREALPLEEAPG